MNTIVRFSLFIAIVILSSAAHADSASLLNQAQAANPTRYQFALNNNAEIRNTSDGKAFTIWWQPAATTPAGIIVTLHGHGSYATDEFYLWQSYAQNKGYAILALQWWFGGGETVADYYLPQEMYPIIASLLKEKGVKPGAVLLHGYSRGAANSYAVTALDAASGYRFITMTLSNAGGAAADFPPNQQIAAGTYGARPFTGIQWIMYCGANDPDPAINGCPAMNAAKNWVTGYGATFKLLIEDANGGHGGFMTNSTNVNTALAQFAPANRYADADSVFDWAERQFPSVLTTHVASQLGPGFYYRCYSNATICLGVINDDLYLYQSQAGGLSRVGTVQDFLP